MKTEKKYSYIFFDLDGTLTDPREGITKSVQYALKHMGILETDLKKLEPFIGPPLMESFAAYYGFGVEDCRKCVNITGSILARRDGERICCSKG